MSVAKDSTMIRVAPMTKPCVESMPTLPAMLDHQALVQPEGIAFTFLEGDRQRPLSFAALRAAARSIAAGLLARVSAGERLVLVCPPGLDYIELFFGCLYAGVVAVPLYPPRMKQRTDRVANVVASSDARLLATTPELVGSLHRCFASQQLPANVAGVSVDSLMAAHARSELPALAADATAFIQYTSGSTGVPKGVMVSHGNIMANVSALTEVTGCAAGDVFVNWLPPFHDLGLITTIMLPVFLGAHSVLMSPASFVQRPSSWLEAIHRHRGSIAGAPNFAYDLCLEKVARDRRDELDLSSWRIAFNAAEPVNHGTLQRFAEAFATAGFDSRAFYPAYGMAEGTAFLSGGAAFAWSGLDRSDPQHPPDEDAPHSQDRGATPVSCGRVAPRHELRIVDPDRCVPLPEGAVGEIWVRGPSIALGYWNLPQLTREVFEARLSGETATYLRTGDLGFVRNAELYISGRRKDMIIVRGQNYFPQDIEATGSASHAALVRNAAVAFGIRDTVGERLVLVQEVKASASNRVNVEALAAEIRAAIAREFELKAEVVLIRQGGLEKTSSGKVRRTATKSRYLAGELQALVASARERRPTARRCQSSAPAAAVVLDIWRTSLKVSDIDLDSDFFALGGDSVDAIRVLTQIEALWDVAIPIEVFYEHPTVAGLVAWYEQRAAQPDTSRRHRRIDRARGPTFSLSHAQQRLWFLQEIEAQRKVLNLAAALSIAGPLDVERLSSALQRVIERHEILRTVYELQDGRVIQRIVSAASISITCDDLRGSPSRYDEAREIALQHAAAPFDLARGPVVRIRLLQLEPEQHRLLVCMHHIAADAWSIDILCRELGAFYADAGAGVSQPEIRYADFAEWQRSDNSMVDAQQLLAYWRNQLAQLPSTLVLPYDHPRPLRQRFEGACYSVPVPPVLCAMARAFAQSQKMTLFVTMLAAFQLQLRRLSGNDDVILGTDIAGRAHPQLQHLMGFFVNQLVLRIGVDESRSFCELARAVKLMVRDAIAHQQMPFDALVEELGVERSNGHAPIFQVKFLLNQAPQPLRLSGLAVERLEQSTLHSQYDLTLSIDVGSDAAMTASFHYQTSLFTQETVAGLMSDYLGILSHALERPGDTLNRIPCYWTQQESYRRQMHGVRCDQRGALKQELELQVSVADHRTAIVCGDRGITYRELHAQANRLAHFLSGCGIEAGGIVGIHLESSIDQVIAVLALIKLGAAFLPLDPDYPRQRIEYMLDDSRVDCVITSDALHEHLAAYTGGIIALESTRALIAGESPQDLPDVDRPPHGAAYVLYTSGSAGQPKGVQIKAESLLNLCRWYQRFAGLSADSCVLQPIPLSFDASIKNILAPLMVGAKVVLPQGRFDPEACNAAVAAHNVSLINCVPSMFHAMLAAAEADGYQSLRSLRLVALGGESPALPKLRRWLRSEACQCALANIYGPTECTDISTAHKVEHAASAHLEEVMPIGRPIDNASIYLVDAQMQLVPPGVAGEVLIGGAGVGLGYIGQAAAGADSQRFLRDEYSGNGRLYRTGDLAMWDRRGLLIYLGRRDEQLKLRGIRIEAAEIEAALLEVPGIAQAKVILANESLRAFLVAAGLTPPSRAQLRERLGRRLPSAWIPKSFVMLPEMTLLSNGKIDVLSLRQVPLPADAECREIEPPRTDVERLLIDIWREVLSIERAGVDENFFQLGGDSMSAVTVVARAKQAGLLVSVADVIEFPTVRELALGRELQSAEMNASEDAEIAFEMLSAADREMLQGLVGR